ncbi:hypothetical protein HPB50_014067 [Hyalomma asiaticum]|uniref:Uncharacterized protein n=1 Tax=Hyalomma asiaticum TaxID=266040 RepID=A0ACB7RQZ2_HYAAI|nr:hypothetical protein HPB50_014067 [Hyalomma asiaticum]
MVEAYVAGQVASVAGSSFGTTTFQNKESKRTIVLAGCVVIVLLAVVDGVLLYLWLGAPRQARSRTASALGDHGGNDGAQGDDSEYPLLVASVAGSSFGTTTFQNKESKRTIVLAGCVVIVLLAVVDGVLLYLWLGAPRQARSRTASALGDHGGNDGAQGDDSEYPLLIPERSTATSGLAGSARQPGAHGLTPTWANNLRRPRIPATISTCMPAADAVAPSTRMAGPD